MIFYMNKVQIFVNICMQDSSGSKKQMCLTSIDLIS